MAATDDIRQQWYRMRADVILDKVSAYDVLRSNGVNLNQVSDEREEQISCPFHGQDKKPSARIYPSSNDSPSHVWCFVCQEKRWDAIGLWRKFNNVPFGQALSAMERAFGIQTPPPPTGLNNEEAREVRDQDPDLAKFKKLYRACEDRLINCRPYYEQLNDMVGYLSAGSILDRVLSRVGKKAWTAEKGVEILEQLLEKIRHKVKTCLAG